MKLGEIMKKVNLEKIRVQGLSPREFSHSEVRKVRRNQQRRMRMSN